MPALIKALQDKDSNVRLSARYALGKIGASAVPALLETLKAADAHTRVSIVYTLAKIGPAATEAVPVLTGMLKDDNKPVREAADYALHHIRANQK